MEIATIAACSYDCDCSNGEKSSGNDCSKDNDKKCASCDTGFNLEQCEYSLESAKASLTSRLDNSYILKTVARGRPRQCYACALLGNTEKLTNLDLSTPGMHLGRITYHQYMEVCHQGTRSMVILINGRLVWPIGVKVWTTLW